MKGNSFFLPKTLASMFLVLFFLLMGIGSGNLIAAERIKFGAVIARSVILDENDQPILVEFDDAGDEVRVVNVPSDYKNDVDSLKIISAADFRFYKNQLEEYKVDHVNDLAVGAILMDRNEFLSQTFVAADNATSYSYPPGGLPESIKSVFVRGKSNRILPSPQELLLLSFSVDLKNSVTPVLESDKSLLLSPEGVVIYNSGNVIAYRVGFFGNPNEPQRFGFRKDDDEIFGPVSGVKVFVSEFAYPGGVAATSDDGKYSFVFKLPQCPLGGFEFTTDVWAELKYKNFLPTGSPDIPYFIRKQEWSYCFAGLRSPLPLAPPVYTEVDFGVTQGHKSDLKVDVMFLTGHAKLINLDGSVVKIGSETKFKAFTEEELPVTQLLYDFNGDGKPDITVKGLRKTIQDEDGNDVNDVFVAETFLSGSEEPDLQGVYFNQEDVPGSSADILDKQPEFTRLLDFEKRIEGGVSFTDNDLQDNTDLAKSAVGVLETISEEDYKNTDILFFRESTGELVMERRGLRDEEVNGRNSTDFNDDEDSFSYRVMLRGPRDTSINVGGGSRTGGYEQWASDNFLTEPFQKREANHLKPGEFVRVVAINRATGYIGTQRVQLKSAGEKLNNQLSVEVDDIEMRPPNLKIWAERDFEVDKGLIRDDDDGQRNYLVGNEGAALTSDTTITIFTEWLDYDGTPLPDGLGADSGEQYGLTGRLAKIVAPNTLQAASTAGSNLAEFPIAPGRKIQAVNVKSNLNSAEHYYIHVVGKPKDQECLAGATCPDFSVGTSAPPYDSRPAVFTPFLTPLFDENMHWETYNSYRELQRDFDASVPNAIEPTKPLPSYVWQYRPEYQFSQYELEMNSILREYTDAAGEPISQELFAGQASERIPTIRSDDDLISIFYSLLSQNIARLAPIDGEQELVFSLGEQEIAAVISSDGRIEFENLEYLDYLDTTDFLSLRLYVNQDAGNILWEWDFTRNGLHVYYKVPGNTEFRDGAVQDDIEILALLEPGEPGFGVIRRADATVRTLGGARLRYRYIPPSTPGIQVQSVTWSFNYRGRYCLEYGVEDKTQCVIRAPGVNFVQTQPAPSPPLVSQQSDDWSVYWEPIDASGDPDWSLWGGTQTNDPGIAASLKAEYTVPPFNFFSMAPNPGSSGAKQIYQGNFAVKTRELKPVVADPMTGSDVAILEAMLWQFGISPQKGIDLRRKSFAGEQGNRIYSSRGNLGPTSNCDNSSANRRDLFSGNWANCSPGDVALEGMVRRLQGRSLATCDSGVGCENIYAGKTNVSSGVVDNSTLSIIAPLWDNYHTAYSKNLGNGLISQATTAWLASGVTLWNGGPSTGLVPTYTAVEHANMLTVAGSPQGNFTRVNLLNSWVRQEASVGHWGRGYPQTNYRLSEGGADEYGSMGLSQIKYSYRYGSPQLRCNAFNSYNFFDPEDSVSSMVVFGSSMCGSGYGFVNAFGANGAWRTNPINTNVDLVGYRQGSNVIHPITPNSADDEYERLIKAIGKYNGGNAMATTTWANMLTATPAGPGNLVFNRTYGIEVIRRYGILPRTYIWVGERFPQFQLDAQGNPVLDANNQPLPHPQAGQPDWCFAYGEDEWQAGKEWADVRRDAFGNPGIPPVGRTACQ